jgi:hypothetical protein
MPTGNPTYGGLGKGCVEASVSLMVVDVFGIVKAPNRL